MLNKLIRLLERVALLAAYTADVLAYRQQTLHRIRVERDLFDR
jgi:hypothetical protein